MFQGQKQLRKLLKCCRKGLNELTFVQDSQPQLQVFASHFAPGSEAAQGNAEMLQKEFACIHSCSAQNEHADMARGRYDV